MKIKKLFHTTLIAAALFFTLWPVHSVSAEESGPYQPEFHTLRAKDGTAIAGELLKTGSDSVIIICPGFYNSKDNRWMRKAADMMLSRYDVLIFDFRGHGSSGGLYTWSAKEYMDVDTVITFARSLGYKKIGILAFSLGAAAALNAEAAGNTVDSMVLISCPSDFASINFHFWEPGMFSDLMDNVDCKWQGKGARTGNFFLAKTRPIDSIRQIKDTPILLIHGDRDWVVKPRHSKKLFGAAATSLKRLEVIKGGLHAERLIQANPAEMKELILGWFSDTLKDESVQLS